MCILISIMPEQSFESNLKLIKLNKETVFKIGRELPFKIQAHIKQYIYLVVWDKILVELKGSWELVLVE